MDFGGLRELAFDGLGVLQCRPLQEEKTYLPKIQQIIRKAAITIYLALTSPDPVDTKFLCGGSKVEEPTSLEILLESMRYSLYSAI